MFFAAIKGIWVMLYDFLVNYVVILGLMISGERLGIFYVLIRKYFILDVKSRRNALMLPLFAGKVSVIIPILVI